MGKFDGIIHRSRSLQTLVIPRLRPLTPIKDNSMLGKAKEMYKELNSYTIGIFWIPVFFEIFWTRLGLESNIPGSDRGDK